MTAVLERPPATPMAAPKPPRGRGLALSLGIGMTVLLLLVVGLVFASFEGSFGSYATVKAELPASSTAVGLGAPVEYRNVTVGTVSSDGHATPGGLVVLTIRMIPSMLARIPAGVTATETPVSFFGDPYVVLNPPASLGSATLKAGATIPALATGQTASLQTTLGDLDSLLVELHPAELDQALTALASALQGQGTSLGKNLDEAQKYFSQMLPLWPDVVKDLQLLVPVSNQFDSSTADILAILSNQTTTASTINRQAATVRQSIGGGATLSTQLSALLGEIQQPYSVLARDSGPFLQDVSQSPTEIARLLAGLDDWAKAWTAAESSGPYLKLTATVAVANPADLGLAILGGPDMVNYLSAGLGSGYVNPGTYSGPASIPANATEAHDVAERLAKAMTPAAPVMDGPAETHAVTGIVRAISGHDPASPSVSSLLLSPVLESLVTR